MWFLLFGVRTALAQDVVVPSFTPRTTLDFGVAALLTEKIVGALQLAGLDAAGGSAVDSRLSLGGGCADQPQCPTLLFQTFPARLGLVGQVANTSDGGLEIVVRYYGHEDPSPIEVMKESVAGGAEQQFAARVAVVATEIVSLLPPREGTATLIPVDELGEDPLALDPDPPPPGTKTSTKQEVVDPWSAGGIDPDATRASPRYGGLAAGDEAERRAMGMLPRWAFARYQASGMEPASWAEEERLRAGLVSLEVFAGAALGDVDRRYDVRVTDSASDPDFDSDGTYQWDSFQNGSGFVLGLAVGYAPIWWFEGLLAVGVESGHKMLSTGYSASDGTTASSNENDLEHDAVASMLALLEPKGRFYLNPIGPAKPYGLAALTLRFYDGYEVPALDGIVFPDRPGGVSFGPTVGAGIAIDATDTMGGFLEVPWTFLVEPRAFYEPDDEADAPARFGGAGQLLRLQAGMSARF